MRLKFIVAYDGEPFAGWQSQAGGNAVQDAIEQAAAKITGARVVFHGSGRTDAGVHALGQCTHADVSGTMTPAEWLRALNAGLPSAVRILSASRCSGDFHARFSAKGKIYRYLIRNAPVLPPHEAGRVWHVPKPLDFSLLRAAAETFQGRHDFTAFSANRGKDERNTTRTIRSVKASRRGSLIALAFEGEGFLYKMVRMLVGAAVHAAEGREAVDSLALRLKRGGPRWNHVAPAAGLYLVKVLY